MNRTGKILLAAIGIAGVGAAAYYLLKREELQRKSKEKAAMDFLRETYGEEALEGKKILLVDEDESAPEKVEELENSVD